MVVVTVTVDRVTDERAQPRVEVVISEPVAAQPRLLVGEDKGTSVPAIWVRVRCRDLVTHIVWDWNGTLFDDLDVVVEAVNSSLQLLGAPPITTEGYRDHYTRPVRTFYERLLRRDVADDEWLAIDEHFHAAYRSRIDRIGLAPDACDALDEVRERRGTQSILSMWWHDELVPAATRLGVADYMVRIDGNRANAGEPKSRLLSAHLDALAAAGPLPPVVMVGDSLDDAAAARANGVACVLFDSGSHHRHELSAAGFPVAATLLEAVEAAGIGAPGSAAASPVTGDG